jgi:hypothetical protein
MKRETFVELIQKISILENKFKFFYKNYFIEKVTFIIRKIVIYIFTEDLA